MNNRIPTVSIETENGAVLINETDYNPDIHELSAEQPEGDGGKKATKAETDAERDDLMKQAKAMGLKPHVNTGVKKLNAMIADASQSNDVKMLVMENNGKHFVVDDKGAAIVAEGVNVEGYDAEKDAWDAILAVNQA